VLPADAAAAVAEKGLRVLIPFDRLSPEAADCLVLSTDSRDLGRDCAAQRVGEVVAELRSSGVLPGAQILYKKIDSTLRGHPGAELTALMEGSGLDRVLIAPAFPAQGRTTVEACQYVRGVRLDRTEFAREAAECDLTRLFGACSEVVVTIDRVHSPERTLEAAYSDSSPFLAIADAETDADLHRLAEAGLAAGLRLFCGSAGLMAALVDAGMERRQAEGRTRPERRSGPVLLVVGSRHPQTRLQVKLLRENGIAVIQVPGPGEASPGSSKLEKRARGLLMQGRDVVLLAESAPDEAPNRPDVVLSLGDLARRIVTDMHLAALVMTGGDTARAVCSALRVSAIRVLGEVLPGIPCGDLMGGRSPALPVVTKAGGFGEADSLEQVLHFLRWESESSGA